MINEHQNYQNGQNDHLNIFAKYFTPMKYFVDIDKCFINIEQYIFGDLNDSS